MQVKSFFIPANGEESFVSELNAFLSSQPIMSIDKIFSENAGGWCILVSYHGNAAKTTKKGTYQEAVDYKSVLSDDEYQRFLMMKDIRFDIHKKEGIPAYLIFTDKELAEISKCKKLSMESLRELDINSKRLNQYAPHFIAKIAENEKNGENDGSDMLPSES